MKLFFFKDMRQINSQKFNKMYLWERYPKTEQVTKMDKQVT